MSGDDPTATAAPVAIVGAGPAGLAAAALLADHGVRPLLIDEAPRPGGQILRQPPRETTVERWLPGPLYRAPKAALRAVEDRADIAWLGGATVLGIDPPDPLAGRDGFELWVDTGARGHRLIAAERVLLATGAYELPVAFPGWTLPGVMGAGALQTLLKSQQILPGDRLVFAGSHPLQLVVADQALDAGAEVALVAFSQSRPAVLAAAARSLRHLGRHWPKVWTPARILARLVARGVAVRFNTVVAEAHGSHTVTAATLAGLDRAGGRAPDGTADRRARVACDTLALCYGFLAGTELARATGAAWTWDLDAGGWLVAHDGAFRSSVPGLYAAGEATGVDGADAALAKGRLAARAILADRGLATSDSTDAARRRDARTLARALAFARDLRRFARPPHRALDRITGADTLVCRCEAITRAGVEAGRQPPLALADMNAVKRATRVGMGACQGRLCGAILARLARPGTGGGQPPRPFTARMPVKPASIAAVAALAEHAADDDRGDETDGG
ncbi:hypothetical protein CCR85_09605 [Rhodothalassium salexigens]|uniref:FAD/NAD(P)-dependent oxidoreductase n=1 Tax=Rhodothalassium salexigens TaxID=1086 RepID=UPI001914CC56|nr:NAD(P)/FAD-dependent oxidoreductase [Rhodothalassium salexigens]MBK5911740.1 hypothetical protein [Rhodothalassium salexigens]MBK5920472.1 hypothetical protein [Rhodothalassium salexigens]